MRKSALLFCALLLSLSARRAWIEIWLFGLLRMFASVALRKESVDRNIFAGKAPYMENASLSARRAWIEINNEATKSDQGAVALRKESVDRNLGYHYSFKLFKRRSPQGERG